MANLVDKLLKRHLDEHPDDGPVALFRGGMDAMAERVQLWVNSELGKIERDPLPVQHNEVRTRLLKQVLSLLKIGDG